jgi:hypothetical protein
MFSPGVHTVVNFEILSFISKVVKYDFLNFIKLSSNINTEIELG